MQNFSTYESQNIWVVLKDGSKLRKMSFTLPEEDWKQLLNLANSKNEKVSLLLRTIIKDWLQAQKM